MSDHYLGAWRLVPELCLYQTGTPPRSGLYRIASDGDGTAITIEWIAADGSSHSIAYGGPIDGSAIASSAPGVTHATITRVDAHTLDSEAFDGAKRLSYARRRVSQDGALLVTVQEAFGPDGTSTHNFQVYRRIAD